LCGTPHHYYSYPLLILERIYFGLVVYLMCFVFFCFSKELYKAPVVFFMCLAMAGLRQDVLLDGYAEVDEVLSHEASCEQLCNKLQQGPRIAGLLRSVHLQRSIHKRVFLYASTCYPAYTFALPYIITYSYLSYITCVA